MERGCFLRHQGRWREFLRCLSSAGFKLPRSITHQHQSTSDQYPACFPLAIPVRQLIAIHHVGFHVKRSPSKSQLTYRAQSVHPPGPPCPAAPPTLLISQLPSSTSFPACIQYLESTNNNPLFPAEEGIMAVPADPVNPVIHSRRLSFTATSSD